MTAQLNTCVVSNEVDKNSTCHRITLSNDVIVIAPFDKVWVIDITNEEFVKNKNPFVKTDQLKSGMIVKHLPV